MCKGGWVSTSGAQEGGRLGSGCGRPTVQEDQQGGVEQYLTNRIGKAQKRRSGERQQQEERKNGEEFRILRITELSY